MKIAVFILLGYITCTLRCEVNKREAENKTKIAINSDTLEPSGNIEEPVGAEQPGHVKTPDPSEPLRNLDQPEDLVTRDAALTSDETEQAEYVMTTDAVEPPNDARQPQNVEIEFPGNTAYQVSTHELHWKNSTLPVDIETKDDSTLPVDTETIDDSTLPVDTEIIDDSTLPVDTETVDDSTLPVDTETIDDSTLPVDTYTVDDFTLPVDTEIIEDSTLPVDAETIDDSTLPVDTETIDDSTLPVDTETIDDSTLPVDTETIDDSTIPVDTETIDDSTIPKNFETSRKVSEDVKITTATAVALNTTYTVYANTTAEPATTKRTDKKIQAYDTGPAKIKVADALKILQISKNKYALASTALIHRLEWLRSTYNVTELVIDHKVDLHDFDKILNTEISSNGSNILRRTFHQGLTHVKHAIMNATSKFLVREPSRFMAQTNMGANEYISKYKSVRTLFGKDEACYIMDAKVQGNIGRYLNHSCCPNVFVQNVFVDTHDPRFPWVAFFALSHIKAGTELTWNYNYDVGSVPGKVLYCYCGAVNCRGRLL